MSTHPGVDRLESATPVSHSSPVDVDSDDDYEDYRAWKASQKSPIEPQNRSQAFADPHPVDPSPKPSARPVNKYAASGWGSKKRVEFDVELPSGALARLVRLDRNDLLSMNLLGELDTFTPLLFDDALTEDERDAQIKEAVKNDPSSVTKMTDAMGKVVLVCTVIPKVTEDPNLVNYGNPTDWEDPDFVPVALLKDIDAFDRMFIFGAAFGRKMEDLKSLIREAQSLDDMAAE